MKKIIFLFIIIFAVFLIYNFTKDDKIYYVSIGDSLARGNTPYNGSGYGYSDMIRDYLKERSKLSRYNKDFTNSDYRITDLIRLIEDSATTTVDGKTVTINHLLKEAELVTLSIGMNELYYKINNKEENLYSYVDQMMNDMSKLLALIKKYNHHKVLVLGYYNYNNSNTEIIEYANLKLRELLAEDGFEYVDINKIFKDNVIYFENDLSFKPNIKGYEEISKIIIEKIQNY